MSTDRASSSPIIAKTRVTLPHPVAERIHDAPKRETGCQRRGAMMRAERFSIPVTARPATTSGSMALAGNVG
jgi:hypothetical protein